MRTKYKDWGHESVVWDWHDEDCGYILFDNDGTITFCTTGGDSDKGCVYTFGSDVELTSDVAKELYDAMKKFYEKE